MDTITSTTNTEAARPLGPMGHEEFTARVAALTVRYGANVALKMARRERTARHPLHKRATSRRTEAATIANNSSTTFHNL